MAGPAPAPDPGDASAACDPLSERTSAPELLIGPDGLEARLEAVIGGAKRNVDVLMYQFRRQRFVDAFIEAEKRGAQVRLLLDQDEWLSSGDNAELQAGGVEVRRSPLRFTHLHSKVIVIDDEAAVVMSGNLSSNLTSARNYGVLVDDPADVADIDALFEADWQGELEPDLGCTRLVVSPTNAHARILEHIGGATETLDLAVMYMTETQVLEAVEEAFTRGVRVRVMLADPRSVDSNEGTARRLADAGIAVRILRSPFLHAKLIVADGVALVGSQNMSYTSLQKNREIGLLVHEPVPAARIARQFDEDWDAAEEP